MNYYCHSIIALYLIFINALSLSAQTIHYDLDAVHSSDRIKIEFNKNIEFLGFVLYIGEPESESSQPSTHPMRLLLDEKRSQLKGEESLHKVFELGAELSYSLFVELFARLDELPLPDDYKIPDNMMHRHYLYTPDEIALVYEILGYVNKFYKLAEFDQFYKSTQVWYEAALSEIIPIKPEVVWIEAMEDFYEQKFAEYKIIPSLTFWSGPGFGFKELREDGDIAYFVLGPLRDDFRFDEKDRLATLAIHEFGHSFVNHLLETTCGDLIDITTPLFDPISHSMSSQGYPNWHYTITEHFVRAGEVLIPELLNDMKMSEDALAWNTVERSFIFLPFIVDRLRYYRIINNLSYEQSLRSTMMDLKNYYLHQR